MTPSQMLSLDQMQGRVANSSFSAATNNINHTPHLHQTLAKIGEIISNTHWNNFQQSDTKKLVFNKCIYVFKELWSFLFAWSTIICYCNTIFQIIIEMKMKFSEASIDYLWVIQLILQMELSDNYTNNTSNNKMISDDAGTERTCNRITNC